MTHLVVTQIGQYGYLGVFVLMVLESACIPVPSEVVMLFGGALAGGFVVAGVHVHMNVVAVALTGTAGNLVGSWIAYAVGRVGGRPLIERFGRYVMLRHDDLDKAERFFARRGTPAVLIGRVLPVVRTFISLPAGIAEMRLVTFSALTVAGSLPWTFALALVGYALAASWKSVSAAFTPISIVVGVLLVATIAWWVVHRVRLRGQEPESADGDTSTTGHLSTSAPPKVSDRA
ncbi:MAG: DedA family protein [Acidimicrobiales bacterium]